MRLEYIFNYIRSNDNQNKSYINNSKWSERIKIVFGGADLFPTSMKIRVQYTIKKFKKQNKNSKIKPINR